MTTPTLDTLKAGHPRLLVGADLVAEAKEKIASDAALSEAHAQLITFADETLSLPLLKFEKPDGRRLLPISRTFLDRAYLLSYATLMTGEARYRERLWAGAEAVADFPSWNPDHYLDLAEMAHGMAIAYDWLFDQWTADQRRAMEEAIYKHSIQPTLGVFRDKERVGWWHTNRFNWNFVCNGGNLAAALAVAETYPDEARELLGHTFASVQIPMQSYEPDGAWAEGPMYWGYATMYAVLYVAVLESALGDTFGLAKLHGFSKTGYNPIFHFGPSGRAFNFSDCTDKKPDIPQLLWLARQYGKPEFAWYHQAVRKEAPRMPSHGRMTPHPLDIFWGYRAEELSAGNVPKKAALHGVEAAFFRSDWENPDALYLAVKAGSNQVGHSHLDGGSFVFDAFGKRWVTDPGTDGNTYQLHRYAPEDRPASKDFYRQRAEGHNTLVVNPGPEPDQNPFGNSVLEDFSDDEAFACVTMDMRDYYPMSLRQARRGVALVQNRQAVIQDEFTPHTVGDVWWFLHTEAEASLSDDGRTAVLTIDDVRCTIRLLAPGDAQFELMAADPLPTSPKPEQADNSELRKLAVHLPRVYNRPERIAVVLIPHRAADEVPETIYDVKALNDWS